MTKIRFIDSFMLHMIAFAIMLCDHMWATLFGQMWWLTHLGRLAFPIFAFMIVEGLHYTHNRKNYLLRLLTLAVISEIPFNMMMTGGSLIYPFHQNVIWTYLFAILMIMLFEKLIKITRSLNRIVAFLILGLSGAFILVFSYIFGYIVGFDFYGEGLFMVYLFYFLRGDEWWKKLGQLVGMIVINWVIFNGMYFEVQIFNHTFEIMQQGFAVFALIPIWLYNGKQGYHSKITRIGFYAFYPVHMLVLSLIAML